MTLVDCWKYSVLGGIEAPSGAEWLDDLTIYAVPMRYDQLFDVEPLDRDAVVTLVGEIEDWAVRFQHRGDR